MLLVFDSHPVQYRVPIWQAISTKKPGSLHVVYGSDCSVQGHVDTGFGHFISWDDPMLEKYAYTILNCVKGKPLSGWGSLTGKGVSELMDKFKPSAVLLTGLNYRYDFVAYFEALRRGIPVWLRCETQDEAIQRTNTKAVLRSLVYNIIYKGFSRFFFIGELNKLHYLKHNVADSKLRPALYGTVDRFINLSVEKKTELRASVRERLGISTSDFVVGFSGKLIQKKNPEILYAMLDHLPAELRSRIYLYFLGSGTLESTLRTESDKVFKKYGVRSYFAGFANQSELPPHYLAMDALVLPSRRMGETWGLVANEAMQAGCSVIVSDAVGCNADFKGWDKFRVFKDNNQIELANQVTDLSKFSRDFNWASQKLTPYSIEATSSSISNELEQLSKV